MGADSKQPLAPLPLLSVRTLGPPSEELEALTAIEGNVFRAILIAARKWRKDRIKERETILEPLIRAQQERLRELKEKERLEAFTRSHGCNPK